MRTITAKRSNVWFIWGSDAGGWGYDFGAKQMLENEHIVSVVDDAGNRRDMYRVYDEKLAIEIGDKEQPPETITVSLMTREEWFAQQRAERERQA